MEDKMKCAFNFTAATAAAPVAVAENTPSKNEAVDKEEPVAVPAPVRAAAPVTAAAVKVGAPEPAKPAAPKPSSPAQKKKEVSKAKATAVPVRSSKTSTKVATTGDTPAEGKARIVLLFAAFIIGVLMGKYVL